MEKKEKVQKPIYKKWWFWLIILCVLGAVGNGLSDGGSPASDASDAPSASSPVESDPAETTPEPDESTPVISEEDKEAAKALDAEIFAICTAAEQDYNAFVSLLSTEGATDLDAYNAAKPLRIIFTDYNYRQLSGIKGNGFDEFEDYKENTSLYIFMMSETVDAAPL